MNNIYNENKKRNKFSLIADNIIDKPNNEDIYSYGHFSKSFKITHDERKNVKIIKKYKKAHKNDKEIKITFYFIISIIYYSLYLLCLKIISDFSMPEIPGLGVSSFIICFNNLLISAIFIKLDFINYREYLNINILKKYFLKLIFNYIKILLTIKSLQQLCLISFIIIINLSPLISSYIFIKENNKAFKPMDSFYYLIFIIICLSEFIVQNKTSIICAFALIIIITFTNFTNVNITKLYHSYLIVFWSSLIGIAISPLIISINNDSFNISLTQYLLFFIICFAYFLFYYFNSKYTQYSRKNEYYLFYNIIIIILYSTYSMILLKEDIHFQSYLYLILSAFINIYGYARIESFYF